MSASRFPAPLEGVEEFKNGPLTFLEGLSRHV
jgi:hypothetical protein